MAIQKNFKIANGLEVNDNLIFADKDQNTVGIGTTVTPQKLQVNGGIGATDLVLSGVGTIPVLKSTEALISNGYINVGVITSLTGTAATITSVAGSVKLGIGTTALVVEGDTRITGILTVGTSSLTLNGETNQINGVTISSGIVTATTFSGDVSLSNGSESAPSIKFSSSTTTGIYSPGTNQFAIATNGVGRITIDASGNVVAGGTLTAGSFSPTSSTVPTNGLYSPGTNQLALSTNGTGRLFVDASGDVRVEKTTTNPKFAVVSSDTGTSTIGLGDSTNNFAGSIAYNNSTNAFTFTRASVTSYTSQNDHVYYTNGTEKLRITSAGLVGIGTSSPSYPLEVSQSSASGDNFIASITNPNTTTTTPTASLVFQLAQSGGTLKRAATITAFKTNTWGSNASTSSALAVNTVNANIISEAVRIDNLGRVGIGTTSPGATLDVVGIAKFSGGGGYVNFGNNGYIRTDDAGFLSLQPGSTGIKFLSVGGSGESARIDSSGRLLVGTSTASKNADRITGNKIALVGVGNTSYPSHVITGYSANNADAGPLIEMQKSRGASDGSMTVVANNDRLGGLQFLGADGTNFIRAAAIIGEVDGTPGANDMPGRLVFSTTADGASSPTERMRIDSSGRVGVGTTSPIAATHIMLSDVTGFSSPANDGLVVERGGGNDLGITIATNNDRNGYLLFADSDSSNPGWVGYDHSVNAMSFRVNASERARIDSSGRLLVGTSTARANFYNSTGTAQIQVEGTNFNNSSISITTNSATDNDAGNFIINKSGGASIGSNTLVANNENIGGIVFNGNDGTEFVTCAAIAALIDGTPGANDMPGRLVFSTTADGASSPTEAMRIRNNGQVLIGATSDAKSGKLEVTGRLAVLNGRESIQTGSTTYTASTTATEIIQFDSGAGSFFGAELFVTLCDTASPAGTIVQKVYVAARGSGANVTAVSISQSDLLRQTSEGGTFTGYLTWTAAVVSNRARLSVTATQASGDATLTVHCNGAPFTFLI